MSTIDVVRQRAAAAFGLGRVPRGGLQDELSEARRLKARAIISLFAFVLVAGLIAYRTLHFLNVPGHPDATNFGMADFRDAVYFPVVALLEGVDPYDVPIYRSTFPVGNSFPLYSPLTLILHLPFGLMPFQASAAAYFFFTLLLTLLLSAVVLTCCRLDLNAERVFSLAALMLASRPGYSNLVLGQCSAEAALSTVLALHFARSRPFLAGLALAVATFKPTYGVPLATLMLFRGDFRAVAIGGLLAVIGAAIPATIVAHSASSTVDTISKIRENLHAFGADPTADPESSLIRVDAYSVFARLIGEGSSPALEWAFTVGLLLGGGWVLYRLSRCRAHGGVDGLSGVLTCLILLVAVYRQPYDMLLLWMPLLAIAIGNRPEWAGAPVLLRWGIALAIALPQVNYISTHFVVGRLGITGHAWTVLAAGNGLALLGALAASSYLALKNGCVDAPTIGPSTAT